MTTCAFPSKVHWAFTFSLSPPLTLPEHCHKCSIGSQSFLLLPLSVATGMSSEHIVGSSLLPHFPYCVIGISFLPSFCSTPFMVGFFRDQSSPWSQRYFWTKLALSSVWTSALPWCLASVQCQCFQLQCHLSITLPLPLILPVCLPNCKWWAAGSDCSSRRWELKILFCCIILSQAILCYNVGNFSLYSSSEWFHLVLGHLSMRNPTAIISFTSAVLVILLTPAPLPAHLLTLPLLLPLMGNGGGERETFYQVHSAPLFTSWEEEFEWLVRPSHKVQVTGWE